MEVGDIVFLYNEKKFAIFVKENYISIEQNNYINIKDVKIKKILQNNTTLNTIKSLAKNGLINNNYHHLSCAFDLLRELNLQIIKYMNTKSI